jgi:hypothetical protein
MAAPKPWTGVKGPTGRAWMWIHQDPSVPRVKHCGHPTALRPYYMPELLWELGAFPNLKHAQKAAELAAAARGRGEDLALDSVGWAIRMEALGMPGMPMPADPSRRARA